jgi:hypothetical protein
MKLRDKTNAADGLFQCGAITTSGIQDFTGTMGDSTKVVGTDAPVDWIEVKIGGTTRYLPAYAA